MDRFTEQSVSDLARSFRLSSSLDRDEDGYPDEPRAEVEPCFACGQVGGIPFLATEDEVFCSRCFETHTQAEFQTFLADCSRVELIGEWRERIRKAAGSERKEAERLTLVKKESA